MVTPCCVWGIHLEVPSSLRGFSRPPWALSKAAAACGVGRRHLQWWGRWGCRQFDPEACISLNLQLRPPWPLDAPWETRPETAHSSNPSGSQLCVSFQATFFFLLMGVNASSGKCKRCSEKDRVRKQRLLGELLSLDPRPQRTYIIFSFLLDSVISVFLFPKCLFILNQGTQNSKLDFPNFYQKPATLVVWCYTLFLKFSLPSSLQTYYTNVIELILWRLG